MGLLRTAGGIFHFCRMDSCEWAALHTFSMRHVEGMVVVGVQKVYVASGDVHSVGGCRFPGSLFATVC